MEEGERERGREGERERERTSIGFFTLYSGGIRGNPGNPGNANSGHHPQKGGAHFKRQETARKPPGNRQETGKIPKISVFGYHL